MTINITGEISGSQDLDVDADITDVVSEHADELIEELKAQGHIESDNDDLVTKLRDRLQGIQTSIENIKSDLGDIS